MPPVVSIVGKSKSGKTTIIEKRDLVELEHHGKKFYMRRLPAHGLA